MVGVDPARDVLLRARRRAPRVPLVRATAHALPFRPGVFDTVISSLVFCSVPDPAQGLDETRRVLAPGGVLLMIEHVRSPHPRAARLQDAIQPLWTRLSGGCHPNRDTEATLERQGFRIDPTERQSRGVVRRLLVRP
jgi:ubiquinone/menaquinone biosynthesis C-methylase UbiE